MKFQINKLDFIYTFLLSIIAFTIPLPMLANNISIILFIVFWLILCFKKQVKASHKNPLILLLIPYAILVVGASYTTNYKQLNVELTKSLPFLLLPLVVFSVPFKIEAARFRTILKWFVFGNFMISLVLMGVIVKTLVFNGFSLETLWGVTHQKLSGVVGLNAIYLSLYFAMGLLYIIYVFLYEKEVLSSPAKFLYALILILLFIGLVFLSSRTVTLSFGILVSALLFQYYLKRIGFFKTFLRFILIGGIISTIVFSINPVLKMRVESVYSSDDFDEAALKEEGVQMRQKLWRSSFEIFKDNVLFGVGTGDFKDELMETYKKNKHRVQYRFQMNSHNQYLSYMVSSGIVGTILFLFYLFYPLSKYAKEKKWLPLLITLMFISCFVTESYLYTNKGVVVVSFFITMMYRNYLDTKLQLQNEQA